MRTLQHENPPAAINTYYGLVPSIVVVPMHVTDKLYGIALVIGVSLHTFRCGLTTRKIVDAPRCTRPQTVLLFGIRQDVPIESLKVSYAFLRFTLHVCQVSFYSQSVQYTVLQYYQ